MDYQAIVLKIKQAVLSANHILLISHQRPDADALGSLFVFSQWLSGEKIKHTIFCKDAELKNYNLAFFINPDLVLTKAEEVLKQNYDLVIIFDSGDLKYAGADEILPQLANHPPLINIDHHATNKSFGDVNLVKADAASTTEILFGFFETLKIKISPEMATGLLSGIIFDTYNFANPNTTSATLAAAAKLLTFGAKLFLVSESILKNKNVEILQTWGAALINLVRQPEYNIAVTVINQDDIPKTTDGTDFTEGIANFLNILSGVKAVLILQQQEGNLVRGNLRTSDELIDVGKLATILGGGGHKKAAGFRLSGQLVKTAEGYWQII